MKGMLGAVGITAGIATVGAAMKSAISSGMDFTNSLNTMKAVSGATDQQLAAVSARARQLGTDNQLAATSSVDAAQAMLELSKGGMSVEQSMTAARGTLQLAAAAQISAAEAATIQSSALQTFGKDASYAGQTADILANAANQSSAEIVDVAYALQQGGTVANQFGVSMGDTAATVSLLANAGIKGSDAGTLMKSALLALTDTTDKQKMAAEQLGLTLSGNGVKFEGMQDLFTKLGTASKTMTREQYNNATSILFGSDAMRLAGVAATQGGEGYAKMAAAMMKQGAASDVAAAKMAGLPGAWEKLKNNAQDAGLAFYDAVQGPLTKMATWGSEAIGKIVDGFTSAGPKVKEAWDQVSGAVKDSGVLEGWGDRLKDIFASLGESVMNLLPTFGKLGELMGMASTIVAAVGIETFVTALESLAGVLEVGVVPIAQALNSVMSSMQPLVVAALAAFMGFRLVGPALAGVGANLAALQAKTVAAAGHMTSFASGWRQTVQWMRAGNPQLSALGASMRLIGVGLGTHVPTLQRMADAYRTTSTNASHFGRTLGVMNAGLVGARGGISKITDALGGGLSTALIAAGIAFMLIQSKNAKATAAAEAYNTAVKNVTSSQNDLYVALMKSRGAVTDDVYSAQEKTISAVQEKLDAVTKSTGSYLDQFRAAGQDSNWSAVLGTFPKTVEMLSKPIDWFGGKSFDYESQDDKMRKDATEAKNLQDSLADLGYNSETLTKAVYGSDAAFDALLKTLTNGDGKFKDKAAYDLAKSWGDARDKFLQQQNAAKQVVPGITELGDAMQIMGDKSASASDKLSALKSAMDLLNPARTKAEAVSQYGETIRKAAESIQGIDKTAFNGGQLDSFTESGQKLGDMLQDLANKSAQVAASGDMDAIGRMSKENQKIFEQLATQTGKSVAEIKALYNSFGGDTVDLTVKLQGDTEVSQKLGLVQTAIKNTPKGVDIKVPADSIAGAESALKQLGIEVSKPKDGMVTITANSADAKAKLDAVVAAVSALPPGKQVAVGAPGGAEVVAMLEAMGVQVNKDNKKDVEVTSPLAPGVLQLLQSIGLEVQTKNGKSVIVTADDTDYQTKKKLGRWSETEYKRVQVQVDEFNNRPTAVGRGGNTIGGAGMGNADGSIRQYVDGGITALEAYANGGARLPNQALIQKPDPKGGLVQWAEPSTKGEAFIPLADGKRTRSLSILSTVAKMFGYELLPDGTIPTSLSGLVGGLTGGLVKHLVGKTGIDGVTRFEDGGLRTAEEFRQLAEGGFGASQPLTGAPYNWGGVNWGDCSGAMAAFARFAAGLPPFGGRFSTATMAAQLQQMGAVMGNGPAGTMRFGWYNGGPGGGHAIGQLPDGANVEMGGANGGGMLGGTAGPDDAQFTDHAYFPVKATTTTDGSGDGTGDGTGDGSGSGDGSGDSTGSGEKTLSARLGKVAESFVSGQVASFMELLNVNDSPGWLAAIAEYENQQKSKSGNGSKLTAEQKQQLKAKYDQEKLDHKQDYDTEVQKLDDQLTAKQISRADYEQKKLDAKRKMEAADLKSKQEYDSKLGKTTSTDGGAKADYEQKKLDRKQAYDAEKARIKAEYQGRKLSDAEKAEQAKRLGDLKIKYENEDLKAQQDYERLKLRGGRTTSTLKPSTPTKKVRDPGTDKPRKDQDLPLPKLFDQGGSFGPGLNLVENKLGKPETGLPFSPDELKRSLEVGRGGDAQILAELRKIAELLARAPRGDHFDFRGDPDARRAQRVVNARNKAALAGL